MEKNQIFISIIFILILPNSLCNLINGSPTHTEPTENLSFAEVLNFMQPHIDLSKDSFAQVKWLSKVSSILTLPNFIKQKLQRQFGSHLPEIRKIIQVSERAKIHWTEKGKLKELQNIMRIHNNFKEQIKSLELKFETVKKEIDDSQRIVQTLLMGPDEKSCQPFENELNRWTDENLGPVKSSELKMLMDEITSEYDKKNR